MDQPDSPTRRHILSSFNPDVDPERRLRQDGERSRDTERRRRKEKEYESVEPRVKKLRLKTDERREKRRDNDEERARRRRRRHDRDIDMLEGEASTDSHRRHHRSPSSRSRSPSHRRRHRHRSRRHRSPTHQPHLKPTLDPDSAFRASLFDALADDEGAAYWEGVYGQPMHIYESARDEPVMNEAGELEKMTDEEYAQWVRERMWAKTNQGMLEEKERRRKIREREREERKEDERRRRKARELERQIEERLKAGEERRAKVERKGAWQRYLSSWTTWDGTLEGIPWPGGERPVEGDEDKVRLFFVQALEDEEMKERAKQMKEERIRWHPDKIQQRLGGTVSEETMASVTMIFQTIDTLWADAKRLS